MFTLSLNDIITNALTLNDIITYDPLTVANAFNDYFSGVADQIGKCDTLRSTEEIKAICHSYRKHPSIKTIQANQISPTPFGFSDTTNVFVQKILRDINPMKSTRYDRIPPKLIKIAANELSYPISNMINQSINSQLSTHNSLLKLDMYI